MPAWTLYTSIPFQDEQLNTRLLKDEHLLHKQPFLVKIGYPSSIKHFANVIKHMGVLMDSSSQKGSDWPPEEHLQV